MKDILITSNKPKYKVLSSKSKQFLTCKYKKGSNNNGKHKQKQIDYLLLSKVNTKQATINIDHMKNQLHKLVEVL